MRRGWRGPLVWAVVTVLVVLAVTLLTVRSTSRTTPLDPDSSQDDGGLAVRSVLAQQGVDVRVVRSQGALLDTPAGAGTTVLVTSSENLSDATARAALQHVAAAARLVVALPRSSALAALALPVDAADEVRYSSMPARCADPDAVRAGRISSGEVSYTPRSVSGAVRCFPAVGGGAYELLLPAAPGRPATTLLGTPDVLANHWVTGSGNAALALGTLGDTAHLVWYVPDVDDVPAGDQSTVASALPRWLAPARLLGWSALAALLLWRGRRLGRLVPEPLPVLVRAIETTQSRGRMYRKAGDRGRAVAVLQAGARSRLARYLGLPTGEDAAALVSAVAAATGRPVQQVAALLGSPTAPTAVPDDPTLLALAGDLAALEKEVRRR